MHCFVPLQWFQCYSAEFTLRQIPETSQSHRQDIPFHYKRLWNEKGGVHFYQLLLYTESQSSPSPRLNRLGGPRGHCDFIFHLRPDGHRLSTGFVQAVLRALSPIHQNLTMSSAVVEKKLRLRNNGKHKGKLSFSPGLHDPKAVLGCSGQHPRTPCSHVSFHCGLASGS